MALVDTCGYYRTYGVPNEIIIFNDGNFSRALAVIQKSISVFVFSSQLWQRSRGIRQIRPIALCFNWNSNVYIEWKHPGSIILYPLTARKILGNLNVKRNLSIFYRTPKRLLSCNQLLICLQFLSSFAVCRRVLSAARLYRCTAASLRVYVGLCDAFLFLIAMLLATRPRYRHKVLCGRDRLAEKVFFFF